MQQRVTPASRANIAAGATTTAAAEGTLKQLYWKRMDKVQLVLSQPNHI